ncbi:MAG: hypothetical protein QG616_1406 [Pseudomonadota bacterium]|nr:hypothetical protein [Pseudomonadota bacterium]MDQ5903805.1 hypothetical protein [Pseudomonadota bacterium]MDQ5905603.1 hypothetical protein [Pseudomonadota bacterium]MDQ5916728.1 hypothetical protein [Pseudomonadota bacterium]MDQ5916992.1 hypothetical protein [Pseudomonadota bacterium]
MTAELAAIEAVTATTAATRTRTILLVDDEENILAAMRRVLRREGYQILTAGSGQEGLELLAAHPVDVIVSDQRMPNMTGVEFLRQAKVTHPDTIRIVLSGYTELQSITDAINEGAIYKFLTKPWDDELIRANIAEAFRQKELGDDNRRLSTELARANTELQALLVEKQHRLALDEASLDIAREILHCMPLPIVGIDDEGMMVFSNPEADALLGDGDTLLGESAAHRLPPEFIARLAEGLGGDFSWQTSAGLRIVLCRRMGSQSRSRGRLLVVMPQGTDEALMKRAAQ